MSHQCFAAFRFDSNLSKDNERALVRKTSVRNQMIARINSMKNLSVRKAAEETLQNDKCTLYIKAIRSIFSSFLTDLWPY